MKRLILFLVCFLSLAGLQAPKNANSDSNHQVEYSPCQKEQDDSSISDTISTLTLLINMANNSLTSWNNQIALWSLILTILSISIAGVGVFGASRIRRFEKKYSQIEEKEELRRKKEEVSDFYMQRINDWMFSISVRLDDKSTSHPNQQPNDTYTKAYLGYYLTRLGFINFPTEKEQTEKMQQAQNNMDQAVKPIVEQGGREELEKLQEMSDAEINEEKKKMLKNAAKKLQNRLIAETNAKSTPQSRRERREKTPAATES